MMKKTFSKDELKELAWGDETTNLKPIQTDMVDNSRWSIIYEQVFEEKATGKFYITSYSVGATECQDESPYEYDDDEIECVEVQPVQVTVTKYEVVK